MDVDRAHVLCGCDDVRRRRSRIARERDPHPYDLSRHVVLPVPAPPSALVSSLSISPRLLDALRHSCTLTASFAPSGPSTTVARRTCWRATTVIVRPIIATTKPA